MSLITVFTPTYNRAYTLDYLYSSLLRQTNKDFEWLIVDDGSTDNTAVIVEKYIKEESSFTIRYYRKENGGKHTAINKGVELAKGSLFFIVDSDDQLMPDAIERLYYWEQTIRDKKGFAGVAGNKGDLEGKLLGTTFSGEYIYANNLERKEKNILGDKAEAYYTHILREYPFPVIEGENFITESIIWDRIGAAGLKICWFNEVIYLVEQRKDGLIAQGNLRFANNPKGYALSVLQTMEIFHSNWRDRLYAGFYFYETIKEKVSLEDAARLLKRNRVGFWMFWKWQSMKIWIKERLGR